MTELFLHFLNSGIAAGWLVLLVLAARLLLKKAPKWVAPALWGIVALRLMLPFSIESALSLIPSAETVSPEVVHYDPRPTITSGVEIIDNAVNPVLSESFAVEDAAASVNPLDIRMSIAGAVWLIGVAVMLGYALVSWARLRRRMRTAVRMEGNVYQSENAPSPFILGVVRPRIYVPFTLQGTALSCVLSHERAHLARRDHWWKPLGYILLSLYWFHPLLWVAYILLCRDIELACDERVIRGATGEQRADYSQALLSCSTDAHTRIAACPLAFGEVGVKARVKRVLGYKKPAFRLVLAAVAVCVVLAVCGLTDPKTDDNTPYRWTSSVTVEDVDRAVLSSGEELTDTQLAALVGALHDVKKSELSGDGQSTPHTARVELFCGEVRYTLSAGGGITEFSCSDNTLFDAPTGPVWEVHNETLATLIVSFSNTTATLPDEPDEPNEQDVPDEPKEPRVLTLPAYEPQLILSVMDAAQVCDESEVNASYIFDLDCDGVDEQIDRDRNLRFRREGTQYRVDLSELLQSAWPELSPWFYIDLDEVSGCLKLGCSVQLNDRSASAPRLLYFDGENLLVYAYDQTVVDHICVAGRAADVPDEVADHAVEQARQLYEDFLTEGDFAATDYRVSTIYQELSFRPEGVPILIYYFRTDLLAAEPESVVMAGGRACDEEGWVSWARYDWPCYLIYTTEGNALRLLGVEIDDGDFIAQIGYGGLIGLLHKNGLGSQQSAKFLYANDLNGDKNPEYLYREGQTLRVLDMSGEVIWSTEVDTEEVYFLDRYENRFLCYAAGKSGASYRLFDLSSGGENTLAQGSVSASASIGERALLADAVNKLLVKGGCELVGGTMGDRVYIDSNAGVFGVYPMGYTPPTENLTFNKHILSVIQGRAEAANGGSFYAGSASSALAPQNDSFQTPGWLVYDIDGDGSSELLFGENGDGAWDGIVYNIYTSNGTRVVDGWERSRYRICEGGVVMHEGASGADDSFITFYRYEHGTLTLIETLYYYRGTYYHGVGKRSSDFLVSYNNGYQTPGFTAVSDSRAEEILAVYNKLSLTFTPFD